MEKFLEGLNKMLIQLDVVTLQDYPNAVLIFATACAIVGIVGVFLDLSYYTLRGQSLLKLNHGKHTFLFLIAWAIGSFIMGYIGQIAKIFQVSLFASVLVGFTWPILFTKLLSNLREKEIEDEPEQLFVEEE